MAYNWFGADFAPSLVTFSLSFIALLIGSITDLKTREVPDWLNYGLIFSGLGINLLVSAMYSNPSFIINSIIGLLIFFGIAYIMFYSGQWGGGDSKILIGLGAMIGLNVSFISSQFLLGFFINTLFAGAAYGILWSFYIAFRNKRKFLKEFTKALNQDNIVRIKQLALLFVIASLVAVFFIKTVYLRILMLSLALLALSTFYLWIFVKAVEKSSMYKLVEPSKLTEGDWIVNDVYVNKRYICGPKDLGIDKKQIRKLIEFYKQGKSKKILIKEGIPFVPSFLIAFVITLIFGNLLLFSIKF